MQVAYHISPSGPVYFDFDDVACPMFVRLAPDFFARFEAVTEDDGMRQAFAAIVGRDLASLLETHRGDASGVREAQEAAALMWYLGHVERLNATRAAIEQAESLLGVSADADASGVIETYSEAEARAWLEAAGFVAEMWAYGLGVQRVQV